MYSPEVASPKEALPDYKFDSSDRDWLKQLGFTWEDNDAQTRLYDLNRLLKLTADTPAQENGTPNLYALTARMNFVNLFSELDSETYDKLINRSDWLLTPKTVIGTQRLLHNYGIDNLNTVIRYPQILSCSPESIRRKIKNFVELGFSPVKLINANPFILDANPNTIKSRLRVLYSATRAWKVQDYEHRVNKIIEQFPDLLNHSVGRNRVLIRILNNGLARGTWLSRSQIRPLIRNNIEGTLAGYLEMEQLPVSPEFIVERGNHFKHLGTLAMREVISDPAHANDPAVKAYRRMKATRHVSHYHHQARSI